MWLTEGVSHDSHDHMNQVSTSSSFGYLLKYYHSDTCNVVKHDILSHNQKKTSNTTIFTSGKSFTDHSSLTKHLRVQDNDVRTVVFPRDVTSCRKNAQKTQEKVD